MGDEPDRACDGSFRAGGNGRRAGEYEADGARFDPVRGVILERVTARPLTGWIIVCAPVKVM
jgi:hypothetical protein